jgi:hypothetical protein
LLTGTQLGYSWDRPSVRIQQPISLLYPYPMERMKQEGLL